MKSLNFYGLLLLLLPCILAKKLGINCRGSGLCPRASWNNKGKSSSTAHRSLQSLRLIVSGTMSIMQGLYQATKVAKKPDSTTYKSGDHVICVSQNQPITVGATGSFTGGGGGGGGGKPVEARAAEPQVNVGGSVSLSGSIGEGGICAFPQSLKKGSITLGEIRRLMGELLKHSCSTCGSVPVDYPKSNDPGNGILTFNYVKAPYCVDNCISGDGTSKMSRRALDTELNIMTRDADPEAGADEENWLVERDGKPCFLIRFGERTLSD